MTRFRKVQIPAHTDYTLTLVRNDGTREPYYLPYVYRTEAEAQRVADERNARYTHGQLVVEAKDRHASVGYTTTLRVG